MLGLVACAGAQEQERKLIDRLLRPDMTLEHNVQRQQFAAPGSTTIKQARTKEFHVRERKPERSFFTRLFGTKNFGTKNSPYANMQAHTATKTRIAKADVPYATSAYRDTAAARESEKAAPVSEFGDTRPFLIQGKSQKALSQKDRPLSIDEVRELLNKNK